MRTASRSEIVLETLAYLRRLKRAGQHAEAIVRFTLERRKRLTPLTEGQIRQYRRDGYLLVSELVPENLVRGAEEAMWQSLGADLRAPETWAALGPRPHIVRDERLTAIYTDAMLGAAAQLAGKDVAAFLRPTHAFTINNVPVSGVWRPHEPHLDYAMVGLWTRTFPPPYWVGALTYLTDVQPHGGGTMVWPGSHLKLEGLTRSDLRKYKYLSALNADVRRVDLGSSVELTPSRGDVLFHHYLCAHAGSDNVSDTPRLAINRKW